MNKKKKFFFFGFGQSAKYLIKELIKSNIKFVFYATNTKSTKKISFSKKTFISYKFKDNKYDRKLLKKLKLVDYVLVSIPPRMGKDIVLRKFRKTFTKLDLKKIIYLSATSVYGNHNGRWVDENSPLKGQTKLGRSRKKAEKLWFDFRKKNKLDINIIRVSGIYSKENNVLQKIKKSKLYVKEKKFFSRIRVEDLAKIIKKVFFTKQKNLVLNASDDKPSTNIEVANYAAKLLKIKNIKAVPISEFKNKFIKDFYKDSKKVKNTKMKRILNIKLIFPTYKEGLKSLIDKTI